MEQFRLILGLVVVAIQLGVAALMVLLFLKSRGERASQYWAIACVAAVVATLVSGFLPLGRPPLWMLYLSAFLTISGLWMVWMGFRNFRGASVPVWGLAVPAGLLVVFAIVLFADTPQVVRSLLFTATSCSLLGMIVFEALIGGKSRSRWLVALAASSNAVSYLARPVLLLLGHDVTWRTDSLPGLLATYLIPLFDYFMMFAGLALLSIQKLLQQKDALATLDELTQLPNRRALIEAARRAVKASCRTGLPFSLMIVDIDNFKDVNDTSGHAVGDRVLCDVGLALSAGCRPTDLVCRYGGDEFVVLCPDLGGEQAGALAQRLSSAVRTVASQVALTVSVGVAGFETCDERSSWEDVFERADKALYTAKDRGRDRIVQA